jgi:hypothetical protein
MICILVAFFIILPKFIPSVTSEIEAAADAYGRGIHSGDSLGSTLIVNSPWLIRSTAGFLWMLMFPIPIFTGFLLGETNTPLYHFCKSIHAIGMLIYVPFLIVGIVQAIRSPKSISVSAQQAVSIWIFFFVSGYMAVTMSTLETRHLIQFLPAIFLIGSIPDLTIDTTRRHLLLAVKLWLSLVIFAHLLWFVMKIVF